MNIHTFGDSHCRHPWSELSNIECHHLGDMLMYTIGKKKLLLTSELIKDDIACFCFGEIDCRCHINKFPDYKQTIDDLVNNYLKFIEINIGPRIWIYNVPPPVQKDSVTENLSYPYLGTDEQRKDYTLYMNKCLKFSKYEFVDIYDKYADSNGFLNKKYSDGNVHINNSIFLKEWINEHI